MNRLNNSPVTYMSYTNTMSPVQILQTHIPNKAQLRLNVQPPKQVQVATTQKAQIITLCDPQDEEKFHAGYGDSHVVTHGERSILSDLKKYSFTDDIKNTADVIYNKMRYQVRRGKIRDQLLFYCVYCAHCELRRNVNPIQLGKLFELTQGEVQRCDSLFSPLQTGYRKPELIVSPLDYLPDHCNAINLSQEAIEGILIMAAGILEKDPSLMQENPQTVASGLLRYYTVLNGITVDDPQHMTIVTSRSNATIDTVYRRIATIDNS